MPGPEREARAGWRRRVARSAPFLAALATLALASGAWLAWPRARAGAQPTRPALCALLVDMSASVTRRRPRHASWLRQELLEAARAACDAGEEVLVVTCAADVERAYGPAPAADFVAALLGRQGALWRPTTSAGGELESRLCAGAELCAREVLVPEREHGRLLVYSDGRASDGELRARLDDLAARGLRIERRELPEPELPDLALTALEGPRELERGADLVLRAGLALAPVAQAAAAPGRIEVLLDCRRGEQVLALRRELAPPGGPAERTSWSAALDLGPLPEGSWEIRARARWLGADGHAADAIPENDTRVWRLRVGEQRLVAVCASAETLRGLPAEWWSASAWPGLELCRVEAGQLAPRLADYDLLLSLDVGPAALPLEALELWLRAGGAWLACSGWGALSGGGVVTDRSSGQASLSPLLAEDEGQPDRDVLLLVDGSGSMKGEPFEHVRAAVHELVLAAAPRDRIQLRFFSGVLGPLAFDSQRGRPPEERARAAAELLATRVPGGSTDILYSVEQLRAERGADDPPALLLLLTDGQTSTADTQRAAELRRGLAAAHIDLRVIAIGLRADVSFLASLLLPGEELVRSLSWAELGGLLAREVHAERVLRAAGIAAVLAPADEPHRSQVGRDLLRSWNDFGSAERGLRCLERTRLASDAEALWNASDGHPLLALHPLGQGWVAALATAVTGDWAPFLVADPGLLAPLVARLARRGERVGEPELLLTGNELLLRGATSAWPPWVELRFAAADGLPEPPWAEAPRVRLGLPSRAPGESLTSLRSAPRPPALDLAAGRPLQATVSGPSGPLAVLGLAPPVPTELEPGPDWDWRAPAEEGPPEPERRGAHPWAAPLLGLGLLCLFLATLAGDLGHQAR